MIQTSDNKYSNHTHSNKSIEATRGKIRASLKLREAMLKIIRTGVGIMLSVTGLCMAAYNIGKASGGEMTSFVFLLVFFICLGVICLGGGIVWKANYGEWVTKH